MDTLDFSVPENLLKEVIFNMNYMLSLIYRRVCGFIYFWLKHQEKILCPPKATRSNMIFIYMWERGQNPCPISSNDVFPFF